MRTLKQKKMKKQSTYILTIALLAFTLLTASGQQAEQFFQAAGTPVNPRVKASWNRYYTHAGITTLCKQMAQAYPELVKLESMGDSHEGREMWVLTISNLKNKSTDEKPGYWIDGNIHSNEVQGTEIALYTAWYLTEMYHSNEFIRELLDDKVFYIAPTINPDARDNYMLEANTGSSPRSGMVPRDDDRDGLIDEDGFDDLNGDGHITMMRRKSLHGNYKSDPENPAIMRRVGPGEVGDYEVLGYEGIDNDGDGRVNEDRQGSYDPNRDWGYNWEPNYIQSGADKYPFAFPENQAVRDFALKHKNIVGAQSYHNSGGMILRGPAIQQGGSEVYSRVDNMVIDQIGKMGEKMIPGYRLLTIWKDMYTVYGGELDWWYGTMGTYIYSNELWTSYLMYYDQERRDRDEFNKYLLFGDAFTPWEEVEHPIYGTVEVGGYKKNYGRLHPGFLLETDAHRNMAFSLYHAFETPKLKIKDVELTKLGGGLTQVDAVIENQRLIPTHSGQNQRYKIDPPNRVKLEGATVVAGMIVLDKDHNRCMEQENRPEEIRIDNINGHSSVRVRWIVKGNPSQISLKSVKGGTDNYTF